MYSKTIIKNKINRGERRGGGSPISVNFRLRRVNAEFLGTTLTSVLLWDRKSAKIMFMVGMEIVFTKKVAGAVDDLNNPTYTTEEITVDDCLVAPITEPTTAREQQAMTQAKDQVRVHMPKASTEDVGGSTFEYDGKTFTLDSSSVKFMDDNTPTRWNRYFRAECLNG